MRNIHRAAFVSVFVLGLALLAVPQVAGARAQVRSQALPACPRRAILHKRWGWHDPDGEWAPQRNHRWGGRDASNAGRPILTHLHLRERHQLW